MHRQHFLERNKFLLRDIDLVFQRGDGFIDRGAIGQQVIRHLPATE